jgi:hypothetical protein
MTWLKILAEILPVVIQTLALPALAMLAKWLSAKSKNEGFLGATARTTEVVRLAIFEIEARMGAQIKAAAADGVLTDGEKAELKKAAISYATSYLGADGLKRLLYVLGLEGPEALDRYLGAKVEAELAGMKASGLMASRRTVADALAERPR